MGYVIDDICLLDLIKTFLNKSYDLFPINKRFSFYISSVIHYQTLFGNSLVYLSKSIRNPRIPFSLISIKSNSLSNLSSVAGSRRLVSNVGKKPRSVSILVFLAFPTSGTKQSMQRQAKQLKRAPSLTAKRLNPSQSTSHSSEKAIALINMHKLRRLSIYHERRKPFKNDEYRVFEVR